LRIARKALIYCKRTCGFLMLRQMVHIVTAGLYKLLPVLLLGSIIKCTLLQCAYGAKYTATLTNQNELSVIKFQSSLSVTISTIATCLRLFSYRRRCTMSITNNTYTLLAQIKFTYSIPTCV
jgi:hypothetical protein